MASSWADSWQNTWADSWGARDSFLGLYKPVKLKEPPSTDTNLGQAPEDTSKPHIKWFLHSVPTVGSLPNFKPVRAVQIPEEPLPKTSFPFLSEVYLSSGPRPITYKLVTWNPRADEQTRQHEQLVAKMLNSMILNGEIVRLENKDIWNLGYNASDQQSWAGSNPPNTLGEALDRIAALLKTLNGGTGP